MEEKVDKTKTIQDDSSRSSSGSSLRFRRLIAISGMAVVVGFGGALAFSRYRAARAAQSALKLEADKMAAVYKSQGSLRQEINEIPSRSNLDSFNPVLYAAKALGIATAIVGGVASLVVVGGIQYGMGIRTMDEFSSRMKLFWGGNFSSLRTAILKNEADSQDEQRSLETGAYGGFKPLNAPPPFSVGRNTEQDDGGQKWWNSLKKEMDEDVANARKNERTNS